MEQIKTNIPILLGPTASGKTGVSLRIAKKFNADADFRRAFPSGIEIISVDSRAIYEGFDIGTAKPSSDDMNIVRHWGIDIKDATETNSVAEFKSYVLSAVKDIFSRGGLPLIVGGTGLYIDALIYDYDFRGRFAPDTDRYKKVEHFLLLGIQTDREVLRKRIRSRAENEIFTSEMLEEAKKLSEKYGWLSEAMKANIYPILHKYFNGEITLDRAKELFFYDDWHLARRQITWFKRNKDIIWLSLEDAETYLTKYIKSLYNNDKCARIKI
jgi:tRNA dimethylallyltransferase